MTESAFLFLPSERGALVESFRQIECDLNQGVYRAVSSRLSWRNRAWLDDTICAMIRLGGA